MTLEILLVSNFHLHAISPTTPYVGEDKNTLLIAEDIFRYL